MAARIFTRRFAGNYLSTLGFIALAYWVIADASVFHRRVLQGQWQFGMFDIDAVLTVRTLFMALIALYVVVLVPFYLRYPWLHSKAFVFLQGLWFTALRLRRPESRAHAARRRRQPWQLPLRVSPSPAARLAFLALLLKFFFAPLMINWCLDHLAHMAGSVMQLIDGVRAGQHGRA
jgi:hypothetical protein